jgi:hypothetical protein
MIVVVLEPSILRELCYALTEVIRGRSSVSFEGNGPAGPARYANVRKGVDANSPVYVQVDGILWNESLVPIMNQLRSSNLPFLELYGVVLSRVSLLLE